MRKTLRLLAITLAICACDRVKAPVYERVASGVWKVEVGTPDKVNLLNVLQTSPKFAAINALEEVPLPVDKDKITMEVFDGKT